MIGDVATATRTVINERLLAAMFPPLKQESKGYVES